MFNVLDEYGNVWYDIFSYFSQKINAEISKSVFWEKYQQYFKMSSAEFFAQYAKH